MGIDNIRIILDKLPDNGFIPGTHISGKVILSVHKRKHIKDLIITLQGKAMVNFYTHEIRWFDKYWHIHNSVKSIGDLCDEDMCHLLNNQRFYRRLSKSSFFRDYQMITFIHQSLLNDGHLEKGDNEFSFSIPLSEKLPSTFVGEHCDLRYKLKVQKKNDTLYKMEFIMVNNRVLKSIDPGLMQPISYDKNLQFPYIGLSMSDPFRVKLSLDKSFYLVGETCKAFVEVHNTSDSTITGVHVSLAQVVLCIGKHMGARSSKNQVTVVCEASCDGLKPGESKSWSVPFIIPNMPNSDINTHPCSIFKICNVIKVTANPSGLFSDTRSVSLYAPVEISSKPPQQMPVAAASTSSVPPNLGFPSSPPNVGFAVSAPPSVASRSSVAPPNIGFVFQPPVGPPGFDDPPPPYPGTPTEIADSINQLRLSKQ